MNVQANDQKVSKLFVSPQNNLAIVMVEENSTYRFEKCLIKDSSLGGCEKITDQIPFASAELFNKKFSESYQRVTDKNNILESTIEISVMNAAVGAFILYSPIGMLMNKSFHAKATVATAAITVVIGAYMYKKLSEKADLIKKYGVNVDDISLARIQKEGMSEDLAKEVSLKSIELLEIMLKRAFSDAFEA
jgi:hypothetical protein